MKRLSERGLTATKRLRWIISFRVRL